MSKIVGLLTTPMPSSSSRCVLNGSGGGWIDGVLGLRISTPNLRSVDLTHDFIILREPPSLLTIQSPS
jgi:hypothetical protein